MCPRNFEGSSAKASLELKYDGGLGTAHGRLRLVHVGTTASDRSMSIAKSGGKTAWAAAIWRRMLRARVVWPAMLIQRTTSGAAGAAREVERRAVCGLNGEQPLHVLEMASRGGGYGVCACRNAIWMGMRMGAP